MRCDVGGDQAGSNYPQENSVQYYEDGSGWNVQELLHFVSCHCPDLNIN